MRSAASHAIRALIPPPLDTPVTPTRAGLIPHSAARLRTRLTARCASCHGAKGEGGDGPALVGGKGTLATPTPKRTVGSYWPYATTVWDYVNRAMPFNQPGTFTFSNNYYGVGKGTADAMANLMMGQLTAFLQGNGEFKDNKVNTFGLFNEMLANPSAFGFANVTTPACGATPSLLCTSANLVTPDAASTFFYADGAHPTTAGHAVIAQAVESMLEGPAQIGALAEAPLAVEKATFRAIDGRMFSSVNAPRATNRFDAWVSYDYGHNDIDGRSLSGNADVNTIVAGGDMKVSDRMLIGVAFSYADNKGDFGATSGGYKLKEATGTVYAGYGDGPWYVGATLGAGDLDFSDVHRNFQLGALSRTETGETRGWQVMGSVLGGYWFTYNDWLHGPFARVSYQEIHVRGFSERGSDSTALSYGEQKRDSLVTSLGWQVAGRIANVRPFARVTWEMEAKDDDRSVQASSVTLGGSYSVSVIKPDRDYAQYLVGASADFSGFTGFLTGSGTSGRSDGDAYAVTVGVRILFQRFRAGDQSSRRGFLGAFANTRS